ncbi:hypothetical protein [Tabrizicola sp.]|uniref:hypothetical protein n=1 Tax=Tabrizicola sp. TaxID=2005166 RepID=UPI00286B6D5E|nr:hypothetical protein [Tabrizicola sp.]
MRHDWIFDVLSDLKAYAIKNNFPALAAKVDEALLEARAEVDAQDEGSNGSSGRGGVPPSGRPH